MRTVLWAALGGLVGAALGLFVLRAFTHIASLWMRSDDDLNDAVAAGLVVWPLLVVASGWLAASLDRRVEQSKAEMRMRKAAAVVLGTAAGIALGDLLLTWLLTLTGWGEAWPRSRTLAIVLATWCALATLGTALITRASRRLSVRDDTRSA